MKAGSVPPSRHRDWDLTKLVREGRAPGMFGRVGSGAWGPGARREREPLAAYGGWDRERFAWSLWQGR